MLIVHKCSHLSLCSYFTYIYTSHSPILCILPSFAYAHTSHMLILHIYSHLKYERISHLFNICLTFSIHFYCKVLDFYKHFRSSKVNHGRHEWPSKLVLYYTSLKRLASNKHYRLFGPIHKLWRNWKVENTIPDPLL